jgi:NAD(P)-dependent dehydrogenase (short-subunit alcohol dehydrogenase family)
MKLHLKPLAEQVIVITGASSGIGLVTAKWAAREGARVVLAARNEHDLIGAVEAIQARGGRATYEVADVANERDVDRIANRAFAEFGGIDTWVNNAGASIYGRCVDVAIDDMRRQFDVIYWGQVYGMLTAIRFLRQRGGAIINVASAVADRAVPLQGNYCAAKHAIKAFTDTLRMELEEEGVPISLTLVKPGSMDTPLFQKARTYLGVEPQPIPPVYAPEVAAEAILDAAQRPMRDIIAGGMGVVVSLAEKVAPRLTDKYMERSTFDAQNTKQPIADGRADNLYQPVEHDGGEHGHFHGRVHGWSAYTDAALHPARAALVVGGAGIAAAAGVMRAKQPTPDETREVQPRAD